ncbi:putative hyaluronan/mRNA-binding protein [Helianthus annuus]|uniref:RGG repeats nuclear RNA binding protein A n=1 Tax=Helianthus annuus TaxID=4232 RepID=UPI000B90970D|nr:RGG repeats nuclear RNA binding protein A [Helianthus annuus]KAJ0899670.1 putative hyaluronan/mRNA-binding protein [Helianthus annuus]
MATANPFDLLVDDDNDDPIQLIAKLPPVAKKSGLTAKLPSKPVQEAKADVQRGGGRFGGRGNGRGGRGFNRDSSENDNLYGTTNGFNGGYKPSDDGEVDKSSERRSYSGPRGGYRGGRRGGYTNGDAEDGERPRRVFERRSGTGRGNEFKREGAGRGNWGTATDKVAFESEEPVVEGEKNVESEKPDDGVDTNKENVADEVEEKEPEEKEMTLEEYEKVLEEKRKALQPLKAEERKVALDKDLAKMQLLSNKKSEDEIFVKLGYEKDKRKEAADKEEKAKKSLSINEFLKPAEGERFYSSGGRGRGRGRGSRGGNRMHDVAAPAIEDVGQFPSLGVNRLAVI